MELFIYTTAAQLAKSRNTNTFHLKINKAILVELLKKAFPLMKNDVNIVNSKNHFKQLIPKIITLPA